MKIDNCLALCASPIGNQINCLAFVSPGSMGPICTEQLWMSPFNQEHLFWIFDLQLVFAVLLVVVKTLNHLLAISVPEGLRDGIENIPCSKPVGVKDEYNWFV